METEPVIPRKDGVQFGDEKPVEKIKLRQKDCYRLGNESINHARENSFPIWKNMFVIGRLSKDGPDLMEEFFKNIFRNESFIKEFGAQSEEDAEAAELIATDLANQMKREFEEWKKTEIEKDNQFKPL